MTSKKEIQQEGERIVTAMKNLLTEYKGIITKLTKKEAIKYRDLINDQCFSWEPFIDSLEMKRIEKLETKVSDEELVKMVYYVGEQDWSYSRLHRKYKVAFSILNKEWEKRERRKRIGEEKK